MVHPVIYALRGWIAFVAFIEFSNAIRCFIDEKQFLQGNLFTAQNETVSPTMARILGRYCLLNGVIMTHCAIFIDHIPVISLSICSLTLSIMLYGSEAFYYYTTAVNFYIVFPILISVFTIICLFIAPVFLDEPTRKKPILFEEDEEEEDDYETNLVKARTGKPQTSFYSSPRGKKMQ